MKQAVIVDCVRTPIGRAHKNLGAYRQVRADDLVVPLVRALVERTKIDPAEIEDVVLGVTGQRDEQGFNLARMVGLLAGLPVETAGTTVNRLCGSSLQALRQSAHSVAAGDEDVHIVGGVEHMHHIPMETSDLVNPRLFERTSKEALLMGQTAEFLAQACNISRARQDAYALQSHQRAAMAQSNGSFRDEIVPIWGHNSKGPALIEADQCVRADTSLEQLSALQPAFQPRNGTVTAANSSPMNDGASALLVMSREKAKSLGLRPLVRIVSTAVAGVDPSWMGTGPVPAARKALARAGLQLSDIDLVEVNEAFAAQVLACMQQLDLSEERLNVRGGAIALGHPLGASGARIVTTLVHNMRDTGARLGMAAMCIGVGQGIAAIFETVD